MPTNMGKNELHTGVREMARKNVREYRDTKQQVREALRLSGYEVEEGEIVTAKFDELNKNRGEVHQVVWFDENENEFSISLIVIDEDGKGEFC